MVDRFGAVLKALKKKAGNLLDYTASSFDRDFVLFKSQIDELDKFTLEFIDDRCAAQTERPQRTRPRFCFFFFFFVLPRPSFSDHSEAQKGHARGALVGCF